MCLVHIVKWCENPTGVGRGFSPQLGQRCLHVKILCSLHLFFCLCSLHFISGYTANTLTKQFLSLFPESHKNLLTQFTPLLCLCTLDSIKTNALVFPFPLVMLMRQIWSSTDYIDPCTYATFNQIIVSSQVPFLRGRASLVIDPMPNRSHYSSRCSQDSSDYQSVTLIFNQCITQLGHCIQLECPYLGVRQVQS